MNLLENIRSHKFIRFILCFLVAYLLMCNLFVNSFYHLKANQKVERIVVQTSQREISITSRDIIEKVNRQFHMQVFPSMGLGALKADKKESFKITFYNARDKEVKGFNYNPLNKKLYPGELRLPPDTQVVMDQIVSPVGVK
ncbi:hypothetical protein [Aminipila luticellarii]|uniref:Uncharacterized protein n=1 Tax=Aminipila luticellarii TaxID=2507160 RepID=A0A410PT73_9FIRM|nr:hypothetical protein [Aminipila luticellarii]QAT42114.1 hypothetical protein EQM06_02075 [Aminipila luticellarii]